MSLTCLINPFFLAMPQLPPQWFTLAMFIPDSTGQSDLLVWSHRYSLNPSLCVVIRLDHGVCLTLPTAQLTVVIHGPGLLHDVPIE